MNAEVGKKAISTGFCMKQPTFFKEKQCFLWGNLPLKFVRARDRKSL
jgi:hypothetical protein